MEIWYALGLLAGMAVAVQGAVNTQLRNALGDPIWAALVSFAVGTAALGVVAVVTRAPAPAHWPTRIWIYSGGLLGALYIVTAILLVPRLGTGTMIGLFVTGQMAMALALDHFALLGVPRHPASGGRILGAALVVAGVLLLRRA